MNVYLIDKNTGEVKQSFSNVTYWDECCVEYSEFGCRGKVYCNENDEYFSLKEL